MSIRMIGVKARPRALISGFDDGTSERLSDLSPTARTIGSSLEDVQTDEWDVLVPNGGGVSWLPSHMFLTSVFLVLESAAPMPVHIAAGSALMIHES